MRRMQGHNRIATFSMQWSYAISHSLILHTEIYAISDTTKRPMQFKKSVLDGQPNNLTLISSTSRLFIEVVLLFLSYIDTNKLPSER